MLTLLYVQDFISTGLKINHQTCLRSRLYNSAWETNTLIGFLQNKTAHFNSPMASFCHPSFWLPDEHRGSLGSLPAPNVALGITRQKSIRMTFKAHHWDRKTTSKNCGLP